MYSLDGGGRKIIRDTTNNFVTKFLNYSSYNSEQKTWLKHYRPLAIIPPCKTRALSLFADFKALNLTIVAVRDPKVGAIHKLLTSLLAVLFSVTLVK